MTISATSPTVRDHLHSFRARDPLLPDPFQLQRRSNRDQSLLPRSLPSTPSSLHSKLQSRSRPLTLQLQLPRSAPRHQSIPAICRVSSQNTQSAIDPVLPAEISAPCSLPRFSRIIFFPSLLSLLPSRNPWRLSASPPSRDQRPILPPFQPFVSGSAPPASREASQRPRIVRTSISPSSATHDPCRPLLPTRDQGNHRFHGLWGSI